MEKVELIGSILICIYMLIIIITLFVFGLQLYDTHKSNSFCADQGYSPERTITIDTKKYVWTKNLNCCKYILDQGGVYVKQCKGFDLSKEETK